MIKLEDERELRLLVFGAALLAIAVRESTWMVSSERCETHVQPLHIEEAQAIAESVVAEAKRLQEVQP